MSVLLAKVREERVTSAAAKRVPHEAIKRGTFIHWVDENVAGVRACSVETEVCTYVNFVYLKLVHISDIGLYQLFCYKLIDLTLCLRL